MSLKRFGNENDARDLLAFYIDLVKTKSYSDHEGDVAEKVVAKMKGLGYDEVFIDKAGNACGRVGDGKTVIHFDSHMDTVLAEDAEGWKHPPFAGVVEDGMLYGRGSVDMKGGLAASVFAAALAKRAGLLEGKTVWVTGSVCEEFCDGVCLEHFYKDSGVRPDFCIICEPSRSCVTLGHTGKVQARIVTDGVSSHGSAPDKGVNAVYEMAPIAARVEALHARLRSSAGAGTIALTHIGCRTASLNAVPDRCEIYLDRRLKFGETVAQAKAELAELVAGVPRAHVEPGTLIHTSWRGTELFYTPEHDPWKIDTDAPLTKACTSVYAEQFGRQPEYRCWDFGTNAVVPVSMGVPTIGFGPGDDALAHMVNERCRLT
ncbi:MAG: YgeY family selenium metabolism-linked hydrolase, partial [Pyramidobacter sp.]|nr:YgeY family selenium metabolism-linked hydrolase [Pyramidobacter sp.]